MLKLPQSPADTQAIRRDRAARTGAMLSVLSSHVCLEIIFDLIDGPTDVSHLAARLELSMPHVSRYLNHLRDVGILACEPRGKQRVYSLAVAVTLSRNEASVEVVIPVRGGTAITLMTPPARPRGT